MAPRSEWEKETFPSPHKIGSEVGKDGEEEDGKAGVCAVSGPVSLAPCRTTNAGKVPNKTVVKSKS